MKTLCILLLALLPLRLFCQILFEKGYFIDNESKKTECLIKNMDWAKNPVDFEFKLTETDAAKKLDINSVKEFLIYNNSRFIRADVKIDRSNTILMPTNYLKEPQWQDERLFLKVLIDGKAQLLYYQDGIVTRYFFSMDNEAPTQLIYREYYVDIPDKGTREIAMDMRFKAQLMFKLQCQGLTEKDFNMTGYLMDSLEGLFRKYYDCTGAPYTNVGETVRRDAVNLRITPGINYSSCSIIHIWHDGDVRDKTIYDPTLSLRVGMDLEVILPFNKNKWGIVFEPTFVQYKAKETESVDLKFIEYPIGFRHYMFLNSELKLHLNAFVVPGFSTDLNSTLWEFDIKQKTNFCFGAGVNYRKFSGELRYYTNRELIKVNLWNTDYSRTSLIAGFQLF